jgi:DNA-binding NarL/FixJ family response regulator
LTDSHRIILVDGSRFLREMLKRVLMKSPELEVAGEVTHLEELPKAIRKTKAQWVICFLLPGSDIPTILETLIVREFPSVRILGISTDGSQVKLEWIGLREKFLDDSSLEELTTLLRSNWLSDEINE